MVYVEKDTNGEWLDTLIVRTTFAANPLNTTPKNIDVQLSAAYAALITGNSAQLAIIFGMASTGDDSIERYFNFSSFIPVITDNVLAEEDRFIMSFSVG